jgi:hypothetical protein
MGEFGPSPEEMGISKEAERPTDEKIATAAETLLNRFDRISTNNGTTEDQKAALKTLELLVNDAVEGFKSRANGTNKKAEEGYVDQGAILYKGYTPEDFGKIAQTLEDTYFDLLSKKVGPRT